VQNQQKLSFLFLFTKLKQFVCAIFTVLLFIFYQICPVVFYTPPYFSAFPAEHSVSAYFIS